MTDPREDEIDVAGRFHRYEDWARLGPTAPFRSATFIDAQGRRCVTERDFLRARDEGAFPLSYYWESRR